MVALYQNPSEWSSTLVLRVASAYGWTSSKLVVVLCLATLLKQLDQAVVCRNGMIPSLPPIQEHRSKGSWLSRGATTSHGLAFLQWLWRTPPCGVPEVGASLRTNSIDVDGVHCLPAISITIRQSAMQLTKTSSIHSNQLPKHRHRA